MKDLKNVMARLQAKIEANARAENEAIKADERHELADNVVTKSNALSRAYYRFNIVEKRCMESLISQLDSRIADQEQLQYLELKAVDYAKAFGVDQKHAYEHLESSVNRLMKHVITIYETNIKQYTLMSYAEYDKGSGIIKASINPLIAKHLIGLRAKFSSYPLKDAVEFKSSYTWRFYELMVSWAQDKSLTNGLLAGWFTVSVDELREMMGVPKSLNFGMFRERVIERSQKELLETANIYLNAEYIKRSRKITHIKFEFLEDEQIRLDLGV